MRTGTRLVVVFTELGQEFSRFAEILSDVRSQGLAGDLDIGALYEEWLRTGSVATERRLHAAGVVVVRGPRTKQ
jgi:hypothetical protein